MKKRIEDIVVDPIDPKNAPKSPGLDSSVSPADYFDFPLPKQEDIDSLLEQGESCVKSYRGRVNYIKNDTVHVTMVDTEGQYYNAELNLELFSHEPWDDMHFLLTEVSQETDKKQYAKLHMYEPPPFYFTKEQINEMERIENMSDEELEQWRNEKQHKKKKE